MSILTSFFALSIAGSAFAQSTCDSGWSVRAQRDRGALNLVLRETGAGGPACDLVVKSFDYLDGAGLLTVEVAPAKFCPLDAVAQRRAHLTWHLPEGLRARGSLKLIVNGSEVGVVTVGLDQVGFRGGCQ